MLFRRIFYQFRYSIGMHRRVVPGRHALALLVPARRHVGMGTRKHHQHFVVEELLPLRIGLRHVHVQHDVLALLVDHHGKVGGMKRAAGAGDQHGEAVGAHELEELGAVLQPIVGRRIHQSTSTTAMAAMPSPRPMKPRRSVVVALTLIAAGAMARSAAMLPIMRLTCGAMRGASAMMVASRLTTFSFSPASFCATSRSSLRLSISENAGSVSG